MADGTSKYAEILSHTPKELATKERLSFHLYDKRSNIGDRRYVDRAIRDSNDLLDGHVPFTQKLHRPRKRRALRRGLRTILGVYCPDLLKLFEQATTERVNWVKEYREHFEKWYEVPHEFEEPFEIRGKMDETRTALFDVTEQLREFIITNFPLRDGDIST
ncbi:hypothetical protein [Amycolatopsis samaneae]|uniref:HEPN AbiU2-like domain-containing protein n=1 Tax=Amycolatopsis samaneae TaxID=664691 RepID=A0ABW5GX71_9PSEU